MHSLDAIDYSLLVRKEQDLKLFSKHSKVSGLRGAIAFALSLRVPCEGALLIWQAAVTEVCQMAREWEFPAMIVAASRSTFSGEYERKGNHSIPFFEVLCQNLGNGLLF